MKKIEKINNTQIIYQAGFAIDQEVDAAVNSANNGLLLGSGEAGKVRMITGRIRKDSAEYDEFYDLCTRLNYPEKQTYVGYACNYWMLDQALTKDKDQEYFGKIQLPSLVQLECLRKIRDNQGSPLDLGSAVLTTSGSLANILNKPKNIIHAVGMGYTWDEIVTPNYVPEGWPMMGFANKGKAKKADYTSIYNSVKNSLILAQEARAKTISLPIMCARTKKLKNGTISMAVTKEQSYQAAMDAILEIKPQLETIIYCAGDKENQEFFRNEGWI